MTRSVLVYSANPADFPEHPDPCTEGGNHGWKPISPFTTNPVLQNYIGKHVCDKCLEIADIPPRQTAAP